MLEDAHEEDTVSKCGAQLALTLYEEDTDALAQDADTVSVCGA